MSSTNPVNVTRRIDADPTATWTTSAGADSFPSGGLTVAADGLWFGVSFLCGPGDHDDDEDGTTTTRFAANHGAFCSKTTTK